MSASALHDSVRFHLSLNVPDLKQAVTFYRTLFGMEPTKHHDDYAKFDLVDPPVVFSLAPRTPDAGCTLSHLGLRVATDEAMDAYRARVEAAGLACQEQNGTTCGYAKQNKVWIRDPFGNFWEIYRIEADVASESVRTSIDGAVAAAASTSRAMVPEESFAIWEHYVASDLPPRIDRDDDSVDEVRLTGSFNASITEDRRIRLAEETFRVLKPGGRVVVHGLLSDRDLGDANPQLPGLAALVSRVPLQSEPVRTLEAAGFVGLQFVKFVEKAWFVHEGAGLREAKLVAIKPVSDGDQVRASEKRSLLYKGPFAEAVVEGGSAFLRGRRTAVSRSLWEALRTGPSAESFVFFDPDRATVGCQAS